MRINEDKWTETHKYTNMHRKSPQVKRGRKNIWRMLKSFPNSITNVTWHIKQSQKPSKGINSKSSTTRHIIAKLTKIKDKKNCERREK